MNFLTLVGLAALVSGLSGLYFLRKHWVLWSAIRTHRNQHADDLCWLDDNTLYEAAGLQPRWPEVGDTEAMLANCRRYIEKRCIGGGAWRSYAELEAENQRYREILMRLDRQFSQHLIHCDVASKQQVHDWFDAVEEVLRVYPSAGETPRK